MTSDIKNTPSRSFSDNGEVARNSVRSSLDGAANAVRPALSHMSERAHDAVEAVTDQVERVGSRLRDDSRALWEAPEAAVKAMRVQVRDRPMAMLGVAVALGFVASWLMSRR